MIVFQYAPCQRKEMTLPSGIPVRVAVQKLMVEASASNREQEFLPSSQIIGREYGLGK